MVRARTLLSCALVSASGCSLVYSKELDDARAPTDIPDAGGLPEAGSGSSSSSGGVEAGVDAGADAGADAGGGCSSFSPAPKFCDDFDAPAELIGDHWTELNQEGGPIVLDSTAWSGTHAGKVNLQTAKSCQYARFERVFDNVGRDRFEARFMMRPRRPWNNFTVLALNLEEGTTAECQPLLSTIKDGSGGIASMNVNVQTGGGATNDQHDLHGVPPTDAWSEISVVVTTNGGHGLDLAMSVDGVTDRMSFPECPSAWNHVRVNVGFHCDTGDAIIDYDDIRVDWDGP